MSVYGKRIEKVRNILEQKDLDAILINTINEGEFTTRPNIFYLTGFLGVWPGSLLITKDEAVLFTNETDKAPKQSFVKDIRDNKELKKISEGFDGKAIGIDGSAPIGSYWNFVQKGQKMADISRDLLKIRAIKDKTEIRKIQAACRHTEKFLEVAERNLKCRSESKLDVLIKQTALNNGVSLAFPNIVAGDSNSSEVHYMDNNSRFSRILMADIGARYDNYCSDFTRTFLIKPTLEMKKAKETLIDLHNLLANFVKPGMKVKDISNKAVEFLKKHGYAKQQFGNFHALGHGVGLDVHEYPGVGMGEDILEENMIITIEPGIYFENKFGVRLENTLLVTKKGQKKLINFEL